MFPQDLPCFEQAMLYLESLRKMVDVFPQSYAYDQKIFFRQQYRRKTLLRYMLSTVKIARPFLPVLVNGRISRVYTCSELVHPSFAIPINLRSSSTIDGKPMDYFPPSESRKRFFLSQAVIVGLILVVIGVVASIFLLKFFLTQASSVVETWTAAIETGCFPDCCNVGDLFWSRVILLCYSLLRLYLVH